jgi:hypothetical protein
MIARAHLGFLALALLVGCNHAGPTMPDGGGQWPDGGGQWPDGGVPSEPRPVLRSSLGLDLSQVAAFAVVAGSSNASAVLRGGGAPFDADDGGVPQGPQLLALTLDGDVLEVTLVENDSPQTGVVSQPQVQQIYPTASWILFSTMGTQVFKKLDDGTYETIGCSLIAARKSDGALFCAPLVIGMPNVIDGRCARVQANAAGDVAYAFAAVVEPNGPLPDTTDFRLYRLSLGGPEGPTAALATNSARYQVLWFLANAAGDLMINYWPTPLDQSVTRTEILPADGGATFTLQGDHNSFAICGEAGDADEDTFYVLSGGGGGYSFDGTLSTVTRSGSSFVETPQTVPLTYPESYGGLYRLADGVYMFSKNDKALVRVIADGAIVAAPTPVVLTGVDQLYDIQGMAIAGGTGQAVFFGSTAAGYEFIRHDGLTQQDIPLEANLELWRVTIGANGAIDFLGIRTDTQEKVRGSVAAGETTVTMSTDGALDPDQVVVFTQIN